VIDLLLEVAAEHPKVLKYPMPTALFMGFGDSSLNFRLNIWSATFEDFFGLRSEVNVLVNDRLKAEGIEIPFPQRDLHLRSVDPEVRTATADAPADHDFRPPGSS
jgi:potassium efflux system protein